MEYETLLLPLGNLLTKAGELMRLADAGDWVALEAGIAEFEKAAHILNDATYIQSLMDAGLADPARDLISQIQMLNGELDKYATETRSQVSSELRQIIQSGKALDAYGR